MRRSKLGDPPFDFSYGSPLSLTGPSSARLYLARVGSSTDRARSERRTHPVRVTGLRASFRLTMCIVTTGLPSTCPPWQIGATLGATPRGYSGNSGRAKRPYFTGLSRSCFKVAEREARHLLPNPLIASAFPIRYFSGLQWAPTDTDRRTDVGGADKESPRAGVPGTL